jgi:phage baseplate assembly protein W
MITRADRNTQKRAAEETYSDVPINFNMNPVTGNLARVTDADAVKGALKQIILAFRGEWPHHPFLGSDAHLRLFEPLDNVTANLLETSVLAAVRNNEPRALVPKVVAKVDTQEDGYTITIYFQIINSTDTHSVTEILRRIR